jgi:hypothetical protein
MFISFVNDNTDPEGRFAPIGSGGWFDDLIFLNVSRVKSKTMAIPPGMVPTGQQRIHRTMLMASISRQIRLL